MRQSQSAVLERGVELGEILDTEPFEAAWAGEARWFVQFLRPAPGTAVDLRVQISADGINWLDHESAKILEVEAVDWISIPVERFGHWIRLHVTRTYGTLSPMLRIYLELKE